MYFQVFKTDVINLNKTKYTKEGMLDIMKDWGASSSRPVFIETKGRDRRELGFVTRGMVRYDEDTGILSIEVGPEITSQFKGSVIVPQVTIEKEYRSTNNDYIIADRYQIQGFQITQETPAFTGLSCTIV